MKNVMPCIMAFVLTCSFMSLFAQPCFEHGLEDYFVKVKDNAAFITDLHLNLPGITISDKADEGISAFINTIKMNDGRDYTFSAAEIKSNSLTTYVRFRQTYNGVPIDHRVVNFRFSNDGSLISVNLFVEPSTEALKHGDSSQNKNLNMSLDKALSEKWGAIEKLTWKKKYIQQDEYYHLIGEGNFIQMKTGLEFLVIYDYQLNSLEVVSNHKREAIMNESTADLQGQPGQVSSGTISVSFPYNDDCNLTSISIENNDEPMQIINYNSGEYYFLAGTYAKTTETFQNSSNNFTFACEPDCSTGGVGDINNFKYENTMTYWHLNKFYEYINGASGNTAFLATADGSISFVVNWASNDEYDILTSPNKIIKFGANCEANGWEDLAEDAHFIIEAGFELLWQNSSVIPTSNDGVLYGVLDYIAQSYSYQFDSGYNGTTVLAYGGNNNARSTEFPSNYSEVSGQMELVKSQVLSSTLMDIYDIIGLDLTNRLVLSTIDGLEIEDYQTDVANALYLTAGEMFTQGLITYVQLCEIGDILETRYAIDLGIVDYYIKDSYAGQTLWNGEINMEDIGNEPNNETQHFWISPSIWNCPPSNPNCYCYPDANNPDCGQDSKPVYDNGINNYIRVRVHNKGCLEEDISGELRVYAAAAATGHSWPNDWIDHEICDGTTCVIVGDQVGQVSLGNYVTDSDGSRIYTIPWVPFNPYQFWQLPQFEEGDDIHVCIMAMIVTDEETQEPFGDINHGSKKLNNNTAMKNMSIKWIDGFNLTEPTTTSAFIIRTPDESDFPPVHGNDTHDVVIKPVIGNGVNDWNTFAIRGTVDIRLGNDILAAWRSVGYAGEGFEWKTENVIRVTGENFILENLPLVKGTDYVIGVTYNPTILFKPVKFALQLLNPDGCSVGGELYDIRLLEIDDEGRGINPSIRNEESPIASLKDQIKVYPNPLANNQNVHIDFGLLAGKISQVQINDGSGKIMIEQLITTSETILTLNTSTLTTGIYYLETVLKDGSILRDRVVIVEK